ncbi:uncharacterized protein LOC116198090 [Punica granatum]|uniref:Uncharacterized protein n=2 Tax=Punica granatum TaxID=22663 RepID=A0A218X2T7_PUNGR|nr:uncharacterized protein LOC116198090 [Punica granatum]OWM79128.1 hypothetical protein CDL15_Pgr003299 [Punica granatum]PKI49223.1 hypothetical protein CRG98_030372 [Punica granatum]
MALPSSKSSSTAAPLTANPNSGRPQNPSPRSSEIANPMRRSFSGNPFVKPSIVANPRGFNPVTPANSPSEFPRRRESIPCLREHEEKENGKDLNPNMRQARVRSPSIGKGTKNFMSPTISAASKFNASPRKKILSERNNDPIHSSCTSLSDLRSSCSSVNVSENLEEPGTKVTVEASHDSTVTDSGAAQEVSSLGSKGSRKKVAFDSIVHEIPPVESPNVGTEADLVNMDEEFANLKPSSPSLLGTEADLVNMDEEFADPKSSSPSLLAPLDADPLVPLLPYDPKTNYLSPRPQFLHYRPSPRIKHYLGEEGNFNFDSLPDGFDLDGLSDTDVTTEETTQSEKESDDASSNETIKDETGLELEPDGVKIAEDEAVETEEAVGAEKRSNRSFFTRSKFIVSIFIALVACLAIAGTHYSPSYLTIQGSSFPMEAEQLRDNIAENMRLWYANSLSYFSALMSEFRGKGYEWDKLQFYNLTELDENPWLGKSDILGNPIQVDNFENVEIGSKEKEQIEYSETEEDVVAEDTADEKAEVPDDGLEEPDEEEEEIMDKSFKFESEQEPEILDADKEVQMEMELEVENHEAPQGAETESDQFELSKVEVENQPQLQMVEVNDQPKLPRVEVEIRPNDPGAEKGSMELEDHDTAAFAVNSESVHSTAISAPVAGVLVALLVAVACLFYLRKRTTSATLKEFQTLQPVEKAKKFDISPVAATRATEFDVVGVDSCPSGMSSFQKNAASSRGTKSVVRKNNEAQSSERKTATGKSLRRESTASSFSDLSLGSSPSFGSFTTYEMIPSKHRNGDEELVITPIRRSSRLRKPVTST